MMQSIPASFLAHSLQTLSAEDQLAVTRAGLGPIFSESFLFGSLLPLSRKNSFCHILALLLCLLAIGENPTRFSGWRFLLLALFQWLTRAWGIKTSRPWLFLWSLFFAAILAPTNLLFATYLFSFSLSIEWAIKNYLQRLCLPIAWLLTLPLALLCFPSFSPIASMMVMILSPIFATLGIIGIFCNLHPLATHFYEFFLTRIFHVLLQIPLPAYWVNEFQASVLFVLIVIIFSINKNYIGFLIATLTLFLSPLLFANRGAIVFNIGQGDSIGLIKNQKIFLVDTGPPPSWQSSLAPIDRALEKNGIGALDGILITHPDLDHYGGLDALLARHPMTGGTWIHPALLQSEKADKVLVMLERHRADIHFLGGDEIPFPSLECRLAPVQSSNEISPLCKFSAGDNQTLLLTGDMDLPSEEFFLHQDRSFLRVNALKIAHHGSKSSSSKSFLEATGAKEAFISVGLHNHYGHPTRETLSRLDQAKMQVHRTDLEGNLYWLQWDVLERLLPGRSIVASSSALGLFRNATSAAFAPE